MDRREFLGASVAAAAGPVLAGVARASFSAGPGAEAGGVALDPVCLPERGKSAVAASSLLTGDARLARGASAELLGLGGDVDVLAGVVCVEAVSPAGRFCVMQWRRGASASGEAPVRFVWPADGRGVLGLVVRMLDDSGEELARGTVELQTGAGEGPKARVGKYLVPLPGRASIDPGAVMERELASVRACPWRGVLMTLAAADARED